MYRSKKKISVATIRLFRNFESIRDLQIILSTFQLTIVFRSLAIDTFVTSVRGSGFVFHIPRTRRFIPLTIRWFAKGGSYLRPGAKWALWGIPRGCSARVTDRWDRETYSIVLATCNWAKERERDREGKDEKEGVAPREDPVIPVSGRSDSP